MEEKKSILSNRLLVWILFILLFSYAIIRAWTIEPLLDEIATFFDYIRTGHYFNSIEHLDANNHILNSFFGHQFFRFFGDHFFLFRLLSLAAFPVYFFSMKSIVQRSIPRTIGVIVFVALVCIPWVFEYFSYSRGYAIAISFFFAALAFVIKWKESNRLIHFAAIFACLWISLVSSLAYLMPSLLIVGYTVVLFVLNRNFEKRRLIYSVAVILGWIAAITPFVIYSFELNAAGALWWGSQDGLWEGTGKSLTRLVLFTDAAWTFYLVVILILFCLVVFFRSWVKTGFCLYLKQTEAMIFILFIASLIGAVLMRFILDVNYPMDRVAMYLVPLFIIFISLFLAKHKFTRYGLLALSFFPISFIFHLNISTSIFSPADRIPTYLSDEIKGSLTNETALSAEYVSHLSYAYSCRDDWEVHMAFTSEINDDFLGYYHVVWQGTNTKEGYEIHQQDSHSKTRILKQISAPSRKLIADTLIRNIDIDDMYFTLFKRQIDSSYRNELIQVELSGKMNFDKPSSNFNVIQIIEGESGKANSTSSPKFDWYFSDRTDINFVFVDRIVQLKPKDKAFNFFLYNSDHRNINVDYIRLRIFNVEAEQKKERRFPLNSL